MEERGLEPLVGMELLILAAAAVAVVMVRLGERAAPVS
jgi:hypothetical protein